VTPADKPTVCVTGPALTETLKILAAIPQPKPVLFWDERRHRYVSLISPR
jgi:hypothetical protein